MFELKTNPSWYKKRKKKQYFVTTLLYTYTVDIRNRRLYVLRFVEKKGKYCIFIQREKKVELTYWIIQKSKRLKMPSKSFWYLRIVFTTLLKLVAFKLYFFVHENKIQCFLCMQHYHRYTRSTYKYFKSVIALFLTNQMLVYGNDVKHLEGRDNRNMS